MIYLFFLLLTIIVLLPVTIGIRFKSTVLPRRTSAVAFHNWQLAELEQDKEAALLPAPEYDQALLEVQRRLIAADSAETTSQKSGLSLLSTILTIVPIAACCLYLLQGVPNLSSQRPPPDRKTASPADLVKNLRKRLVQMDPNSAVTAKGWSLLGRVEAEQHHMREAAEAWRNALRAHFDPFLAVAAAEADSEANGHMTQDDADLFRKALQAAPDAPFRPMVERRLKSIAAP